MPFPAPKALYFGIINLVFLSTKLTEGSVDCNYVSDTAHYITSEDFRLTADDGNFVMCAAYYCSPTRDVLQLTINSFNYSIDSIIFYLDIKALTLDGSCGNCLSKPKNNGTTDIGECNPCPVVQPAKSIEIHVRFSKSAHVVSADGQCNVANGFNMTVREVGNTGSVVCEGGLALNIPKEDCAISETTKKYVTCIVPTCPHVTLKTEDMVLGYNHSMKKTVAKQACVWEIDTGFHKNLSFSFSDAISKQFLMFEGDLLTPVYNMKKCTQNAVTVSVTANKFYLVYLNTQPLATDAEFSVRFYNSICEVPNVPDSSVELKQMESGSLLATYTCNEGFRLVGFTQILCRNKAWEDPPNCIPDGDTAPSGEPKVDEVTSLEIEATEPLGMDDKSVGDKTSSTEGSGRYDPNFDYDEIIDADNTEDAVYEYQPQDNISFPHNTPNVTRTFPVWPNSSMDDIVLFNFPSFEENRLTFILAGSGAVLIVVLSILIVIVCHCKRASKLKRRRTFDHHQNPIYEKPVAQITSRESDDDDGLEKVDLGYMSDSTALD